jgi:hypothetical protein
MAEALHSLQPTPRVRDAKIERVADLSSIRQITMPWIGLDPDDIPLAIREVGTEEIYALHWATR